MSIQKEVRRRHKVVIWFAKLLLVPYLKIKYRYHYKKEKKLKKQGPFLILGNHTVPMDPILMGLSFPFHNYYIASDQIFNLGFLSKLLVYAVNPIKKAKSMSDMSTIRKAKRIVDQGGSIGLFPEGNVTYHGRTVTINESTVKLIRLLKIPVIIFKTEGLYLSNPRWAIFQKKGKSRGYIDQILPVETYQKWTDQELYEWLIKALETNCYEIKATFKGKEIALGLERLVFMDLEANVPNQNYSKKNWLKSHVSSFEMTYLEQGYIEWKQQIFELYTIDQYVKESYMKYLQAHPDFEFKTKVELTKTMANKRISLKTFDLTLYTNKVVCKNEKMLLEFSFDDIKAMAIQGKQKLIIYHLEETYLMTFDLHVSPYQFLLTYQRHQFIKEQPHESIDIHQLGL